MLQISVFVHDVVEKFSFFLDLVENFSTVVEGSRVFLFFFFGMLSGSFRSFGEIGLSDIAG